MSRFASRFLVVMAFLVLFGTAGFAQSSYGGDRTNAWRRAYRLTPVDHKRMRAMGLTDKEVFFVANTAYATGVDPDEIVQMIFRGMTFTQIADEFNLRGDLVMKSVEPQWTTPEWQAAVQRGDPSWPPIGMRSSMPPPSSSMPPPSSSMPR
jgi:hypothetical protein